ncbi:MAG: sulfatase-like hydrolase/transferase [Tetrasphaera sp.]|nr:sulfatase-like hydrolase/transferase [Tetrasphaera sp.]
MDDVFGAIISQVRASGQLSKTLVIFTSDNGLMCSERGLSKKYVPYSPSVRVPLMLAYPDVFAPGTASAAAAPKAKVSNIDILRKILSVTGTGMDPSTRRVLTVVPWLLNPTGMRCFSEYWRDRATPRPGLRRSPRGPASPMAAAPSSSRTTARAGGDPGIVRLQDRPRSDDQPHPARRRNPVLDL